jgi:hypothetical protein
MQSIDFLAYKLNEKDCYVLLNSIPNRSFMNMGYSMMSVYQDLVKQVKQTSDYPQTNLIPVHFQPFIKRTGEEHLFKSQLNIHMKIVELVWYNNKWNFIRVREDRQS